ncbi:MAG: type II toxin-antitoxin system HicA family toxin [Patescibacteria group bacterium]|mgnify:CR=1 FL=1
MPKLPQISGWKLVKSLVKDGWQVVSQRGSHVKLTKRSIDFGNITVIIPQHKFLKKGTLSNILKLSNLKIRN